MSTEKFIRYSSQAIARIEGLSGSEVLDFLNELTTESLNRVLDKLPPPKGFRRNSENGRKKLAGDLSRRLTGELSQSNTAKERDIDVLEMAWIAWGVEKLGDTKAINALVEGLKIEETSETDDDELTEGQLRAVQEFIQRMEDLAHQNRTSRESVERFLYFGPTTINSDLEGELSSIKGHVDVEKARQLEALPTVVSLLQETIARIEADQNEFDGKLNEAAKALTEQSRHLSDQKKKS